MDEGTLNSVIYGVLRTCIERKVRVEDVLELDTLLELLNNVRAILDSEPTLLHLPAGIKVVGDIHGNIDDLLRIFERCGYPPDTRYLFLGDYVDRGKHGVEVLALLFALKCKFPDHVHLLRGNHETMQISRAYGFMKECCEKYCTLLFAEACFVFESLPIAAVIENAIFCVHGGISPKLGSLESLERMSKPREILRGVFVDLLWSDPSETTEEFVPNSRGLGCFFGHSVLTEFLNENNLQLMIRSHETCASGVHWPYQGQRTCLTVFSNSDYCGQGNDAMVVGVNSELSLTKDQLPCLTMEERDRRRVLLPVWLLEHLATSGRLSDESDMDSQPEEVAGLDVFAIDM